jgi:carbonic anhydrase
MATKAAGRRRHLSGKIEIACLEIDRLAEDFIVKKVFHFDSPRERYQCDAAILWCFDNRFNLGFQKFLKRIGVVHPDPIKVAGGAKCLASPEQETEREFLLEQIRKSMRLHDTKRVILMVHSDCGAYGGLADAFGGDAQAEAAHHQRELALAAANLAKAIPGIEIQAYFADFEGIWDAELTSPQTTEQRVVAS